MTVNAVLNNYESV